MIDKKSIWFFAYFEMYDTFPMETAVEDIIAVK